MLSENVPEARFLKEFFKKHYDHPNQSTNPKQSIIYIEKPIYYHEIVNEEMIQILDHVQTEFLLLVAEMIEDGEEKKTFLNDVAVLQSEETSIEIKDQAARRIHTTVLKYGEYIGYGDYLTFEKFYSAKGLSQSGVTALERKEFIKYFKIALFHLKMNKVSHSLSLLNIKEE